jgi:hypothetical protein
MPKLSKKALAVAVTTAVLLGGSGIAFAFWTAGGSGAGTAAAGTTEPIVAVQTSTVTDLRPEGAAQILTGNFTNGNTGPVYVTSVTAAIAGVAKADGAAAGECTAGDFTLADPVMDVAVEIPSGTAQGEWTGASLAFKNSSTANQDACKGATVTLSYSIV